MATFISLVTYNPLTTQGEGEKYINIEQIVFVEPLTDEAGKEIKQRYDRVLIDILYKCHDTISQRHHIFQTYIVAV